MTETVRRLMLESAALSAPLNARFTFRGSMRVPMVVVKTNPSAVAFQCVPARGRSSFCWRCRSLSASMTILACGRARLLSADLAPLGSAAHHPKGGSLAVG
jgi:hypothetical protein